MILKQEILDAQEKWGQGIVRIGEQKLDSKTFVNEMYHSEALFKPTMAKEFPFRLKFDEAVSYFCKGKIEEDNGFALKPWTKVRFENAKIVLFDNHAMAMGHYFFTDLDNNETKVEYSFVYLKNEEGIKISLHHSSLP
jgi:hypothetical protein